MLIDGTDDLILGARRDSPLVVGWGEGEMYLGSDALAVGPFPVQTFGPHDLKVSIDNRRHLLHRLAWLWMTGALPRWNVEHINGDRSDNRWANLRQGERDLKLEHRAPLREPTDIKDVWQIEDRFEATVEIDPFPGLQAAGRAVAGFEAGDAS